MPIRGVVWVYTQGRPGTEIRSFGRRRPRGAADQWPDSEQLVGIAGHVNPSSLFTAAIDPDFHVGRTERGHRFEALCFVPEELEAGIGRTATRSLCANILHEDKPAGVAHGQNPKYH